MTDPPGTDQAAKRGRARPALRAELVRLLELVGVSAFAVAQPALDILGQSPETFAFYGAGAFWVVLFGVAWATIPPLALWIAGLATRTLGARVRARAHHVTIWGLCALIGFQVLKRGTEAPGPWILAGGLLLGTLLAALLLVARTPRRWLRFTSVATVPSVLAFLFLSPVSDLVLPAAVEAEAAEDAERTPIVFVIFDQLPTASLVDQNAEINRRLFPNFARLADGSTWYRHYTTVAFHTTYAVPAILSGKNPVLGKKATFRDHPENLYTMLAETHRLHRFGVMGNLCGGLCVDPEPPDEEEGTPGAVSDGVELRPLVRDSVRAWWDLSAPYRVERAIEDQFEEDTGPTRRGAWGRFIDTLHPSDAPTLSYVHIIMPHPPWRTLPSGTNYDYLSVPRLEQKALDTSDGPLLLADEQWPMQLLRQRHILQVQNVDRLLGELLDRLHETGLYDRSLVVITSDHGLLNYTGHNERNLHEILWAPLFIKTPGQNEGRVDDANMWSVDLLPTIADLLGTSVPWETDGASVLDPAVDRPPVKVFDNPETPDVDENWVVTLEEALEAMKQDAFRPVVEDPDDAMLPYRVGPGAHLIGERVESFDTGPPSGLRAVIANDDDAFDHVEPGSEVPAFVVGGVPEAGNGRLVALALNGRIAGVSPTYRLGNRDGRFSLMIPEPLFRQGRNEVQLFLLEGETLRPLELG